MSMLSAPAPVRNACSQALDPALDLLPEVNADTLSAAFYATPYASFLLDQDARVLTYNRRAERMYAPALSAPTQTGGSRRMHDLTRLSRAEFARALRNGATHGSVELPMVAPKCTNTTRPTMFRVALLPSPDGGELLYLLTQDHMKAAAEALCQMNRRRIETREELARFKTRFVDLHTSLIAMESFAHQASHDLRTPLSTLSGVLELFGNKFGTELPEKALEYLAVMTRAVAQMDMLTSDFLDHARSVSAEVSAEPLDLRQAIDDVRRDLQNGLTEAELSLQIEGPNCTLMAEPTLLRMMLMNLLSNALKYQHPDRALRINVTLEAVDSQKMLLRIADNGLGFDPQESETIFLPFRRCHTSIQGTGLGLSTCSEVCQRHGWTISAHSDGVSGATFCVQFPRTRKS